MRLPGETMVRVRDLDHASDLFIEACRVGKSRRKLSKSTRDKYREILHTFSRVYADEKRHDEITTEDVTDFMSGYEGHSASTYNLYLNALKQFFSWLEDEEIIPHDPTRKLRYKRRPRPEDLDVVTIDMEDVQAMWAAAHGWPEILCLATLSLAGVRRAAAANARRGDADLEAGTIRFFEKGGKEIIKPLSRDFLKLLYEAENQGVWSGPWDYLIPSPGVSQNQKEHRERDPRVITALVKKIGERAGVAVHPHALRAAFAVQFAEQFPGQLQALKELMGHRRYETTEIYLRRQDKLKAMRQVEGLSWFPTSSPLTAVSQDPQPQEESGEARNRRFSGLAPDEGLSDVSGPLGTKLEQLRSESSRRARR